MPDVLDDVGAGLTPAGRRLLDAASDLFYQRGLHAVGVDLIADTAGTTKKTLYDRFGSKDALVALYLRRRAQRWQAFVLDHIDRNAPEPGVQRVMAVFDVLEAWMAQYDRGCSFVNAHAEITDADHPAIPVIRAQKRWDRELYVRLLDEAGLPAAGDQLMLLQEGATVARTVGGQPDAIDVARTAARALLQGMARFRDG
jgi:AcrR family transcriptional regulator